MSDSLKLIPEKYRDELRINLKQAAEVLGVSPRTVQRWVARGDLRAYKLGHLQFAPSDLAAFIESTATA